MGKEITNFKMTELGPLPEDWEVVKLGEVCDFKGGTQPPKSQFLPYPKEGYIRLLQIRDFETDEYATYVPYSQKLRIVSEEDVLIARYGASVGKILRGKTGAINVALVKTIPKQSKLNKDFLFYLLQEMQFQTFLKSLGGRSAQAGFNKGELGAFLIPLPPLPEQKAIARVLKAIQDAIEATERVIAAAKELKKSLMRHLFTYGPVPVSERDRVRLKQTEIGPIPEDWEVVKLGDYFNVQSGGTPSRKIKEYWENGSIPWITSSQCQDCIVNQADQFITEAGLKNSSAKLIEPNAVLVAMVGATVGKTGFLTFKATTNQNVAAIWPKESIKADSWFTFYNLQTRYHEFKKREKFSIANLTFIRNLKIPLPPLPIQQKIAWILKAVDDKIEAEEKKKKALQTFFKTMLHHLMTGKIRVKQKKEGNK